MKILSAVLAAVVLAFQPAFAADAPVPGPVIGIGTELKLEGGRPFVSSVLPDSPALNAGVKPGDRVVAVDNKSVTGMTLLKVATLLRGAEHSHVKMTVDRHGQARNFGMRREILYLPGSHQPEKP
jgi:C-terminal processing protease CtpA/Prc